MHASLLLFYSYIIMYINDEEMASNVTMPTCFRYRSNENFTNGMTAMAHVPTVGSGLSSGLGGSVSGTTGGKLTSLPASPFVQRASKSTSFSSHVRLTGKYGSSVEAAAAAAAAAAAGKKPLVLFTYLDAQEHLPYADDSTAVTPKSELNGGIVVDTPTRMGLARKLSYNSHTGKLVDNSYNSHTDLRCYPPGTGGEGRGLCSASGSTKEGILTKRMATLFNESIKHPTSSPNSIVLEPITDHSLHRHYSENESGRLNTAGNNFITNGKDSVDLQVRPSTPVFFQIVLFACATAFSHAV